MSVWEIFIIGVHALAYWAWYQDSMTISRWRWRRHVRRSLIKNPIDRSFEEKLRNMLEETEREMRKEAMDRHPTSNKNSGMFKVDSQALANYMAESGRFEKRRSRKKRNFGPNQNFWPMFNDFEID